MPTVPHLTRPNVVLQSTPASVAPAVDPFAAASDSLARGLGNVAGVIARERQRQDEIRVNEAEVEFGRELDAALTGRDGLMQQQGTKAVSGLDAFRDRVGLALSRVEAGLATEEQKDLFRRAAMARQNAAFARADAHVGSEERKADAQSHAALLAQDMATVPTAVNDAAVADTLDRVTERIRLYADRNGTAPELAAQQVKAARSQAWTARVLALVDAGDVEAAKLTAYERSDEFTAEARAKIEPALQEAQERVSITSAASRILATAETATEAYEMTTQIADLGTRQAVRKLVEAEFAAKEEAQNRDREQVYLKNAALVQANPGRPARATVAPAEWVLMSPSQQSALERLNEVTENDDKAWFQFYSMRPEERAKLTPAQFQTQYWSKFDEAHRTRAEALYKDSTQDRTGTGTSAGIMTDNERIRATLTSMHLVSKPQQKDWSEADFAFATTFEQEADTRIRALEAEKGGKATATEKQDIITALGWQMAPVSVRDDWKGDRTMTQVEVRAEGAGQRAYVPYEKIPEAQRQRMTEAMRTNGRNATKRALEDAYGAFLMGERNRYDTLLGRAVPPGSF